MRFIPTRPPRVFGVGADGSIKLKECAKIALAPDELVTFTADGTQYDVTRKDFGYYATTSLNRRLGRFGLRPALVKSYDATFYVMLVIKGREAVFQKYLKDTGQTMVMWLDLQETLEGLVGGGPPAASGEGLAPSGTRRLGARSVCLCGSREFKPLFRYTSPPPGETRFSFSGGAYRRDILRCAACGHCVSVHKMRMEGFYAGGYVDATYGDRMLASFKRIIGLPPGKSDNAARAAAVCAFSGRRFGKASTRGRSILDVGSGLCVFLHAMKARGWKGSALDPDPRAAKHARDAVKVKAVAADFMKAKPFGRFDAISFNKVLEHFEDPVAALRRAKAFLKKGGFVYVELPDAETAAAKGPGREEFFIEHHHIFSAASFGILAARAGWVLKELERVREPSTKFTLRGYLVLP